MCNIFIKLIYASHKITSTFYSGKSPLRELLITLLRISVCSQHNTEWVSL